MPKLILTSILLFLFSSCISLDMKDNSKWQKFGSTFLNDLYNKRYQNCISSMDNIVKVAFKDVNLDSAFNMLSNKVRNDYGGQISSTLISSEKTFHENLPATFLIFKVESADKYGYYYFYVNDKTNKILLVSEFSLVKEKRK